MAITPAWSDTAHSVRLLFDDEVDHSDPAFRGADSNYEGSDVAIIHPAALFNDLASTVASSSQQKTDVVFTSIELPRRTKSRLRTNRNHLPSLIVRASTAASSTEDEESIYDFPFVSLPAVYRHHFNQQVLSDMAPSVLLRPHTPSTLTRITLAATSKATFAHVQQKGLEGIERHLDARLLRQGDVVDTEFGSFRVISCEPTLQGIVLQDSTDVYVTTGRDLQLSAPYESVLSTRSFANSSQESLIDQRHAVVDEQFLARGVFDSAESGYTPQLDADITFTDGVEITLAIDILHDETALRAALTSWGDRAGQDVSSMDLQSCILLDEGAFPSMAAMEGEWALIGIEHSQKARAVKLLCAPRELADASGRKALLSPLLLQSLRGGDVSEGSAQLPNLMLRTIGARDSTSSEGEALDVGRDCPLSLPFADALTISRVAGPLSINRKYQTLFLSALRDYFQVSRRIVQQNDVFAVKFDTSKAQWAVEGNEEGQDDEAHDVTLPLSWEGNANSADGVVYFKITDVAAELSQDVDAMSQGRGQDDWLNDVARTGQYGCIVDTTLTKMVQAGISKCKSSYADEWLDVASGIAPLPASSSPLVNEDSVYARLMKLVRATLIPQASDYGLHLSVLLKGARGSGKRTTAHWVAQQTGLHLVELNCFDLIGDTDARTEGILRARFAQAADCAPAILLLRHVDALARKGQALETGQEPAMAAILEDCVDELKRTSSAKSGQLSHPVAVFATTADAERCPTGVLACFRHELAFEAPNEAERRAMLESILSRTSLGMDVSLKSLATQTAALVAADLVDLVKRAQLAAIERVRQGSCQSSDDASIVQAGVSITGDDLETALNKTRQSYSDNIGAPKIPNVTWDDVGGLASVKGDIMDTIQLPLDHPELFADGLKKRSGILLYGPPGTGKTLLAKAVATSCSLNFFSVKGPELLNMYIGESEANVRRVFQRARDAKPCVIFFDELDSIAPKRGNQGDSGGVMDRIVSQLLAELDGMSSGGTSSDVFVIGATNRPDLLDPALLRPGRFDRMLYLAVSGTHAEQLNILQALTRKFKLDADVGDLSIIAEQCPMNLTGADFYALCSDAMLKSMTRKAEWIDKEVARLNGEGQQAMQRGETASYPVPLTTQHYLDEMAKPEDLDVRVSRADFEAALSELIPSVSAQEMQHYRAVQARFSSTEEEAPAQEAPPNGQNGYRIPGDETNHASSMTMGELAEAVRQSRLQPAGSNINVPTSHSNGHAASLPGYTNDSTREESEVTPVGDEEDAAMNGSASARRKAKGKGKAKE